MGVGGWGGCPFSGTVFLGIDARAEGLLLFSHMAKVVMARGTQTKGAEMSKDREGGLVYMGYLVVQDDPDDDRTHLAIYPETSGFTPDLGSAQALAREILEEGPGLSVLIFEVEPILRLTGRMVFDVVAQEVQPRESWRNGGEGLGFSDGDSFTRTSFVIDEGDSLPGRGEA